MNEWDRNQRRYSMAHPIAYLHVPLYWLHPCDAHCMAALLDNGLDYIDNMPPFIAR